MTPSVLTTYEAEVIKAAQALSVTLDAVALAELVAEAKKLGPPDGPHLWESTAAGAVLKAHRGRVRAALDAAQAARYELHVSQGLRLIIERRTMGELEPSKSPADFCNYVGAWLDRLLARCREALASPMGEFNVPTGRHDELVRHLLYNVNPDRTEDQLQKVARDLVITWDAEHEFIESLWNTEAMLPMDGEDICVKNPCGPWGEVIALTKRTMRRKGYDPQRGRDCDLLMEILVEVIQAMQRFHCCSSWKTYVTSIALHVIDRESAYRMDWRDHDGGTIGEWGDEDGELRSTIEPTDNAATAGEAADWFGAMGKILADLGAMVSSLQFKVLCKRDVRELSVEETAECLGITEKRVYEEHSRAKYAIRKGMVKAVKPIVEKGKVKTTKPQVALGCYIVGHYRIVHGSSRSQARDHLGVRVNEIDKCMVVVLVAMYPMWPMFVESLPEYDEYESKVLTYLDTNGLVTES